MDTNAQEMEEPTYDDPEAREKTLAEIHRSINQPDLTQQPFSELNGDQAYDKAKLQSDRMKKYWADRRAKKEKAVKADVAKEAKVRSEYFDLSEMRPAPGIVCEVDGLGLPEKRIPCLLMTEINSQSNLFWGTPTGELVRIGTAKSEFRLWRPMAHVERPTGVIAPKKKEPKGETEEASSGDIRKPHGYWDRLLEGLEVGESTYVPVPLGGNRLKIQNQAYGGVNGARRRLGRDFVSETTGSGVKITRRS